VNTSIHGQLELTKYKLGLLSEMNPTGSGFYRLSCVRQACTAVN